MKKVSLKFFSVEEKLPEKSGYYVTVVKGYEELGGLYILHYSTRHKKFNTYDHQEKPVYAINNIIYWADVNNINNIIKGEEQW